MGNCCSDEAGGRAAVGGTLAASTGGTSNDAVDFFLRSRGFHGIFSQIELSFSATNLRDRDVLSKSDPMVVVYTKGRDGPPIEVFRTEVVLNSLNPTWIMKYSITFQFEVVQNLLFRVYDIDSQFHNVEVKIVTKPLRSLTLDLVHKEDSTLSSHPRGGQLVVHAEECISSKTTTEMILRCSDLEHKDLFSRINPFLVISKTVENGNPIPVCRTEVLKNDHNPIWKPIFLNIQQVGSKDSPLVIECYNFNSNGKHDLIGELRKSLAELEKLRSSGGSENLFLPNAVGHDHHNKALKSQLYVERFSESIKYTFLDYLKGGCELNFMVAIDFTASNGNPRLPDSLHYLDPSARPNAYQQAIMEVGEVLQFYDSDKRFPAWGFGARPIDGPVSHCFNLNGSNNHCEVEGIQGIMMAYTSALFNVSLAGPTLFGPVINTAALIASQSLANGGKKYFVLLIITDGVVTDLQETKDAIVKASDLPLSILIVGVGGADFKEMEILDADKGERLESSAGRVASRDIVQFIPFRNVQSGQASVVQALLAELPTQFLTYMRSRDIQPNV
ncbi:protein BONZAI 1 isoform X2 [Ricinus communis]|uniref:protein BONZAI 1 isoform X2 n=1 Tax=Ricinus communis TaxID=3988 RepID=UPI000D69EC79|nr:protein BONZAI 1 isoform X2 [Ricinus communis]|eukprot:XP_025014113.1 protein BONZAI 1 isoform X2 [Ricinus communis]